MKRETFLRERQSDWRKLETLVERFKTTSHRKMNGDNVTELAKVYRAVCYDLSMVQSREWGSDLESYLNDLVADGHNCLHRSPPRSWKAFLDFLTDGFPRIMRKRRWFFWAAFSLFTIPFVAAMLVGIYEPSIAETIVDKSMLGNANEGYSEELYTDVDDRYVGERSYMAGFYVLNNIGIAFRCFAKGAFFGVGSAAELLFNGIVLGLITGYIVGNGNGLNFFSFVITHGSFELTAIVIAGAAGLLIGFGMIHPGQNTRWESLKECGLDAIKMVFGAGIMLAIAALIEGFFSPMAIPKVIKFVVGTMCWVAVILYFSLCGRGETARAS